MISLQSRQRTNLSRKPMGNGMTNSPIITTNGLKPVKNAPGWFQLGSQICPIDDHKDKGCMVHENGSVICMKVASDEPVSWGLGGYKHYPNGKKRTSTRTHRTVSLDRAESTVNEMDFKSSHAVYQWLKKKYPLADDDRMFLAEQKGLKTHDRYFTLPKPIRQDFAYLLPEIKGKVAGKYISTRNGSQERLFAGLYYGITCCMINLDGLITGLEIRVSDESKKSITEFYAARGIEKKFDDGSIYRPASSRGLPGGKGADSFVSVYGEWDKTETIILTEGLAKAQVAHEHFGIPVMTVRGVGNWRQLSKMLFEAAVRNKRIKNVLVAFDMDKSNKSGRHGTVKQAYEGMVKDLEGLMTFNVKTLEWDDEHKGIDDAILAGAEIRTIDHKNPITQDLNEIREKLFNDIKNMITLNEGFYNLINVTPGVGKTYTAAFVLNHFNAHGWPQIQNGKRKRDMKICLCLDNKQMVAETMALLDFPTTPLEGRNPDDNSLFHCYDYDHVQIIAQSGKNTFETACSGCEMMEICPYLNNSRQILNGRFVITTKHAILNNSDRAQNFDVLIIDEAIREFILEEKVFTRQDVVNNIAVFERIKNSIEKMEDERAIEFFNIPKDAFYDHTISVYKASAIENYTKYLNQLKRALKLIDDGTAVPMDLEFELIPQVNVPEQFKFYMNHAEKGNIKGVMIGNQIVVYPKNMFSYFGNKYYFLEPSGVITMKSVNRKNVTSLKSTTVLNLDATPLPFTKRLFGEHLIEHRYDVYQNIEIHQVTNAMYSKRQLKDERYRNGILEALNGVKKKYKKRWGVGVITNKNFHEFLESNEMNKHFVMGYHGKDSKGTNKFKHCDILIQVGVYIENMEATRRDAKLLQGEGIEITTEELIEEITGAETLQTLSRLRGVNRTSENKGIVLLLTNRLIKGIKPDRLFADVNDWLNDIDLHKKTKTKVDEKMTKKQQKKSASNPVIVQTDPPFLNYPIKEYRDSEKGGSEPSCDIPKDWRSIRSRLDLKYLRSVSDKVKNVSSELWGKCMDALEMGFESVSDLVKQLGSSESTIKRIRRAIIHFTAARDDLPLPEPDTPQEMLEAGQDAVEIAAFAREEYFDFLIAEFEETAQMTRDFKSFFKFYRKNCADVREEKTGMDQKLSEALKTIRDYPDHENSYDWFWMCYFEAHAASLVKVLLKYYPWIVLEWILKKELDGK